MRGFNWFQAGVVVAAGFAVYAPALHGAFLWDDPQYVTANPLLRDAGGLWKAWTAPGSVMEFYPLQETVLWLQWQLWGAAPFWDHLTNVLLHIVSALLLWRFFAQLGLRRGWLGGLIFLLHPANIESVAWISELKNTLAMPFFLVAMTALVRFEETRRGSDYAVSLAAFTLAMLAKISMAPFPFVILLYAWWKRGRVEARDVRVAVPFLAVAVVLAGLTVFAYERFGALHPGHPAIPPIGGPLAHLALAGLTTSFYLLHLFWPWPLAPIYTPWTVHPPSWLDLLPWLGWFALLAWAWRKRAAYGRHLLLGLGFFLLMIAPFSGLATQSYMYFTWVMDHFLYIAMIGPVGLVVAGVNALARRLATLQRWVGGAVVALVLLALGLGSRAYAVEWTSGERLWTYTTRHEPGAWLGWYNLGNAAQYSGRYDDAIPLYEESIRLNPAFDWSRDNLGTCLATTGQLADAVTQYREAIRLRPDFPEAHNNLANVLSRAGRLDEAIAEYQIAIAERPDMIAARYNMALGLLNAGRRPEAAAQLREIIRQEPQFTAAHVLLQEAK